MYQELKNCVRKLSKAPKLHKYITHTHTQLTIYITSHNYNFLATEQLVFFINN